MFLFAIFSPAIPSPTPDDQIEELFSETELCGFDTVLQKRPHGQLNFVNKYFSL
jgi:hypothetical protein